MNYTTLRSIENEVPIKKVKIKIPQKLHKLARKTGLRKFSVYIVSVYDNGIWVKSNFKLHRVYSLAPINVKEVLDWKITKIIK